MICVFLGVFVHFFSFFLFVATALQCKPLNWIKDLRESNAIVKRDAQRMGKKPRTTNFYSILDLCDFIKEEIKSIEPDECEQRIFRGEFFFSSFSGWINHNACIEFTNLNMSASNAMNGR